MNRTIIILLLVVSTTAAAFSQNQTKSWADWSKEDVDKMLNKSAWGHAVVNTDASEMTVTFGVSQTDQGTRNQAISWNYRVRLFSAKPIRAAFAKKLLLENPSLKPAQLENFVNGDYSDTIVLADRKSTRLNSSHR